MKEVPCSEGMREQAYLLVNKLKEGGVILADGKEVEHIFTTLRARGFSPVNGDGMRSGLCNKAGIVVRIKEEATIQVLSPCEMPDKDRRDFVKRIFTGICSDFGILVAGPL